MILPQTEPLHQTHRYPLTGTLLLLNIFIYFVFFSGHVEHAVEPKILSRASTEITGRLYTQYLQTLPPSEKKMRPVWTAKLATDSAENMETLGAFALRDGPFLTAAADETFTGDQVAIATWKKDLADFIGHYDQDRVSGFGLSHAHLASWSWITYQFSHAGLAHLFSNMIFLVVVGTAVETLTGGLTLLMVYVLGGIVGGAAFLQVSGNAIVPMVGASASISALLAFYLVIETRRRIRYVYFVSPFPGHYGFIYLPTLLLAPLFLLVDFTSLISSPEGLGGSVAYSAHAGGTIFGLVAGLFARYVLKLAPLKEMEADPASIQTRK